jgi:hypothetical protein
MAKNKLRLWVAAGSVHQTDSGAATAAIETSLAFLDVAASALPGNLDFSRQPTGLSGGAPAQIAAILPVAGDGNWLERQLHAVVPPAKQRGSRPAANVPENVATGAAGLFLLLPAMFELGIPALLAANAPSADVAQCWLAWLAQQCLVGSRPVSLPDDPAFLPALGLAGPLGETQQRTAMQAATPNRLNDLLAEFWSVLHRGQHIDGRQLAVSATPGGEVIHDMLADFWLAVTVDREKTLARLSHTLDLPPAQVWPVGDQPPAAEPGATFARFYKPATDAYRYFHLPALNNEINRGLMPLSQAVLRQFARQLIGFGWSSPDYLHQNFFAGTGRLTIKPDQIDVLLPQTPLGSVLRMAGLHQAEYRLPWAIELNVRILLP